MKERNDFILCDSTNNKTPQKSSFFSLSECSKKNNNLFVLLLFLFLKSSLHLNYFPPLLIFFFVFFSRLYLSIYLFFSFDSFITFIVEKRSSHGNSVSFCSQVFVFILRKEWIYINCL